jgi:hypothetical protein
MSLLTPDQRAIFDETVRLRALEVLNAGEDSLPGVPGVTVVGGGVGAGPQHTLKPGSRVKKGEKALLKATLAVGLALLLPFVNSHTHTHFSQRSFFAVQNTVQLMTASTLR